MEVTGSKRAIFFFFFAIFDLEFVRCGKIGVLLVSLEDQGLRNGPQRKCKFLVSNKFFFGFSFFVPIFFFNTKLILMGFTFTFIVLLD